MPEPSAASISRIAAVGACWLAALCAAPPSIVKPPNGAWIRGDTVEIIAKATGGRLLLDGAEVSVERPFPGVLHARVPVAAGQHALSVESGEGTQSVTFVAGPEHLDPEAKPYADHPPVSIECQHCHGVSRRGRFRFSGGCDSCHAKEQFIRTHSHEAHELASCGMCHDAHGSSAASLLVLSRDRACTQCHN